MRIGVIGAGRMAAVLAQRWIAAGHEVMIGARDAERGKALAARLGPDVASGTLREAAEFGGAALLAIWPTDVIPALLAAGAA
jgi:predicted dinucleotide-binding enzyme